MKKKTEVNLHQMVQEAMRIPDIAESLIAIEDIRSFANQEEARILALPAQKQRRMGYWGAAIGGGAFAAICGGAAALGAVVPELVAVGVMLLGGATAMGGHHLGEKIGKKKGADILKDRRIDLYEYVYIHDHIDKQIEKRLSGAKYAVKQMVEQSSLDKMAAKYPDLSAHFMASVSEKALPPKPAPTITPDMLKNG